MTDFGIICVAIHECSYMIDKCLKIIGFDIISIEKKKIRQSKEIII